MENIIYIVFTDDGNNLVAEGVCFDEEMAKNMVNEKSKQDSSIKCWYETIKK